jgi:hypothetical protein
MKYAWLPFAVLILLLLFGCTPAPQAQGQLPLPTPNEQRWTFVPMTGGPGLRTACFKGDRYTVIQSTPYRGEEWRMSADAPLSMTVAVGACR